MLRKILRVEVLMPEEMEERLTKDDVVVVVRVRIACAFQGPLLQGGNPCEQELSGQEKPAALH